MKKIGIGFQSNGLNIHFFNSMLRVTMFKWRVRKYFYSKKHYKFCVEYDVIQDEIFIGITLKKQIK